MSVRIHPKYIGRDDHVFLWDLGPAKPTAPAAPVKPEEGKLKGADLDLAMIHYEDSFETYRKDLRHYGLLKQEYEQWHAINRGPIKISQWSTDAAFTLEREPDRYKIELPKGMKPGEAQLRADRIAEEEAGELQKAKDRDPQFGSSER